jgi:hypothetical protein
MDNYAMLLTKLLSILLLFTLVIKVKLRRNPAPDRRVRCNSIFWDVVVAAMP